MSAAAAEDYRPVEAAARRKQLELSPSVRPEEVRPGGGGAYVASVAVLFNSPPGGRADEFSALVNYS